jgi:hypothetical protein
MIGDIVRYPVRAVWVAIQTQVHGVGIVTGIHKPEQQRKLYEVKWLKSEERMRFSMRRI